MNKKEKVYEFFNKTENYLGKNFGVKVRQNIVRDLLVEVKNKKILDIGCGDGSLSLPFLEDNQLTLIDISENMLHLVNERVPDKLKNNINTICQKFEFFPMEQKYDIVLAIGVLAHLPNIKDVLIKIKSHLNDNGICIIQFSNADSRLVKWNIKRRKSKHPINKIRYPIINELVGQIGFQIEREIQYGIFPPGYGKLPNEMLFNFTMLTYQKRWLSNFGSEFIWLMKV